MRATLFILALAMLPPAHARAQALPPDLAPSVNELVASADAAGLPSERLRQKALEGAVKGIPAARILAVLADLRHTLDDAGAIVDAAAPKKLPPADRRSLVASAADALKAGIGRDGVAEVAGVGLRQGHGPESARGALRTLADLSLQGFDREQARGLVKLALEQGLSEADFGELTGVVQELASRGQSGDALQVARKAVQEGKRPASITLPVPAVDSGLPPGVGRGRGKAPPKPEPPKGGKGH
jgi:hypothetical protein